MLGAVAIAGCGNGDDDDDSGDAGGGFDASTDATTDAGKGAGQDASKDGGDADDATRTGDGDSGGSGDAASDSGNDAATDSGVDAGPDAGPTATIHYYGRFDTTDEGATTDAPIFDWSGTGIVAEFQGTGVAVTLTNYPYSTLGSTYDQLQVLIDGSPTTPVTGLGLALDGNGTCALGNTCSAVYTLASNLADGQHRVEIYKRTEALYGYIQFGGFQNVSGGSADWALVPTPDPYPRRIEFIGDSITAGFGVLGVPSDPSKTAADSCYRDTTGKTTLADSTDNGDVNDAYVSFAGDTAHALGASFVAIAHSGIGVYVDVNGDPTDVMANQYPQTVENFSSSTYDFATPVDVVVINLGTNDFSAYQSNPGTPFIDAYEALVATVRGKYPSAYILLLAGPLVTQYSPYTGAITDLKADLDEVVASFTKNGDTNIADVAVGDEPDCSTTNDEDQCGCGEHPNVAEQSAVSGVIVPLIKAAKGWQ